MRDIGVTHLRFGLQTFNLTSTLKQIAETAALATRYCPYQTCDLLYGFNGQDEMDLIDDLEKAVALGTTNIDIYPIDNVMTQVILHRAIENKNHQERRPHASFQ